MKIQIPSIQSINFLVISSTFRAMKFFDTCQQGDVVERNIFCLMGGRPMFLTTETNYWHVSKTFIAQKVLEITQKITLHIEGLRIFKNWLFNFFCEQLFCWSKQKLVICNIAQLFLSKTHEKVVSYEQNFASCKHWTSDFLLM